MSFSGHRCRSPSSSLSNEKHKSRSGHNDEIRKRHDAGIKYTVYSNPTPPAPSLLRRAPRAPEDYAAPYRLLSEAFPECQTMLVPNSLSKVRPDCRLRDLARFITKDAQTDYDKAVALENWLESSLSYTLEMRAPREGLDPVEFFVFERRKGHCEYFSSAMAIMGRAVGLPTRNVNGFLGGEWNEYDGYIAVRAGDAHSWVEVYFEGHGWVTFDPTPAGEADLLGRGGGGILSRLRRLADTLRFKWFKWVIEYDLYAQLKLFKNIGKKLKGGAQELLRNPLKGTGGWAKRHRKTLGALVLGAGLFFTFVVLWRKRGEASEKVRRAGRSPVVKLYKRALRLLERRGHHKHEAKTPREFALELERAGVPGAKGVRQLTELYYSAEYGEATPGSLARAEELLAALKVSFKTGAPAEVTLI